MRNYFKAIEHHPHHLSIGAVVLNDKNEVLCHHFSAVLVEGKPMRNLYLLMRETAKPNETIEETIARGLMEEFGAKAEIEEFLGAIVSDFPVKEFTFEKTTIYFKCRLLSIDESKRDKNDPESISKITFLLVDDLIEKMKTQAKKYHRSDINEIKMLKRIKI